MQSYKYGGAWRSVNMLAALGLVVMAFGGHVWEGDQLSDIQDMLFGFKIE
jgi:hypothetical protein